MADKDYMATRLFRDRDSAEREYNAFVARGYDAKDINVIMTEEGRKRHFSGGTTTELGNKALEGAGVGGGVGAVAGGTLAAVAAAATVAVPGGACSSPGRSRPPWRVRERARSSGAVSEHWWAGESPKSGSRGTGVV